MPNLTQEKTTLERWVKDVNLISTGEAAQMCGYLDGRTFLKHAKNYKLAPVSYWGKKAFFRREDVEKIAKAIKNEKAKKGAL